MHKYNNESMRNSLHANIEKTALIDGNPETLQLDPANVDLDKLSCKIKQGKLGIYRNRELFDQGSRDGCSSYC